MPFYWEPGVLRDGEWVRPTAPVLRKVGFPIQVCLIFTTRCPFFQRQACCYDFLHLLSTVTIKIQVFFHGVLFIFVGVEASWHNFWPETISQAFSSLGKHPSNPISLSVWCLSIPGQLGCICPLGASGVGGVLVSLWGLTSAGVLAPRHHGCSAGLSGASVGEAIISCGVLLGTGPWPRFRTPGMWEGPESCPWLATRGVALGLRRCFLFLALSLVPEYSLTILRCTAAVTRFRHIVDVLWPARTEVKCYPLQAINTMQPWESLFILAARCLGLNTSSWTSKVVFSYLSLFN